MIDPLVADQHNDPFKGAPSFTLRQRMVRAIWVLTWAVFASWTPPQLRRWRLALLRLFGARLDVSAQVYGSAKVWYPPNLEMAAYASLGPGVVCYNMAKIHVGKFVVVSQRAHLCCGSHDITRREFQLFAKPIVIRDNAWICAEAFVGPGVTIGEGAVLGARGVAMRDLEPWKIYSGNPASSIKNRPQFERI